MVQQLGSIKFNSILKSSFPPRVLLSFYPKTRQIPSSSTTHQIEMQHSVCVHTCVLWILPWLHRCSRSLDFLADSLSLVLYATGFISLPLLYDTDRGVTDSTEQVVVGTIVKQKETNSKTKKTHINSSLKYLILELPSIHIKYQAHIIAYIMYHFFSHGTMKKQQHRSKSNYSSSNLVSSHYEHSSIQLWWVNTLPKTMTASAT